MKAWYKLIIRDLCDFEGMVWTSLSMESVDTESMVHTMVGPIESMKDCTSDSMA